MVTATPRVNEGVGRQDPAGASELREGEPLVCCGSTWLSQGEEGRASDGATTYLGGRVHLLGTMHGQRDLAALAARRCALHNQTLRGESLEQGRERGTDHKTAWWGGFFFHAGGWIPGPHPC